MAQRKKNKKAGTRKSQHETRRRRSRSAKGKRGGQGRTSTSGDAHGGPPATFEYHQRPSALQHRFWESAEPVGPWGSAQPRRPESSAPHDQRERQRESGGPARESTAQRRTRASAKHQRSAGAKRPYQSWQSHASPSVPSSLSQVFEALAGILVPYARLFQSEMHPNMGYCLKAAHGRPAKELYFGGVKLNADHVSYHLFLLYSFPDLEERMSERLRACLEGKTCFRIERYDPALFNEIEALTRISFERFRAGGLYDPTSEPQPGNSAGLAL
jgi:hypothetical protein